MFQFLLCVAGTREENVAFDRFSHSVEVSVILNPPFGKSADQVSRKNEQRFGGSRGQPCQASVEEARAGIVCGDSDAQSGIGVQKTRKRSVMRASRSEPDRRFYFPARPEMVVPVS